MNNQKILILGVTASGKSKIAFDLAKQIDAEIISVDSMKVYRRMDIGTAKPPETATQRIKYHLIDVVEPSESFSVAAFLDGVKIATEQIKARGKNIIAVGGTALYIKTLLFGLFDGPGTDENIRKKLRQRCETEGLMQLYKDLERIDPPAAERIHPNDSRRIIRALEVYELTGKPISEFQQQFNANTPTENWTLIGVRREKEQESKRINARVKKMIELGLVDEVKTLLNEEKPLSKQARAAIGYAETIDHLKGNINLEDAVEKMKKNTRHLAKHQRTWFKTFKNVNYLDIKDDQSTDQTLEQAGGLIEKLK